MSAYTLRVDVCVTLPRARGVYLLECSMRVLHGESNRGQASPRPTIQRMCQPQEAVQTQRNQTIVQRDSPERSMCVSVGAIPSNAGRMGDRQQHERVSYKACQRMRTVQAAECGNPGLHRRPHIVNMAMITFVCRPACTRCAACTGAQRTSQRKAFRGGVRRCDSSEAGQEIGLSYHHEPA